jgi:hypothetical protein
MKLTEQKLKQFIKEELQKLSEMDDHNFDMAMDNIINMAMQQKMNKESLLQMISGQWDFITNSMMNQ